MQEIESIGRDFQTIHSFSAIVAAWNESPFIEAHIRSFIDMNWLTSELIVCAGGTDDTYEKARRLTGPTVIVLLQQLGEGKQSALRKCLQAARYDVIYLTDADCLFERQAIENLLRPLAVGETAVATGWTRPLPEQVGIPIVQYQWARDCFTFGRGGFYANGILGRNAVIFKDVLIAVKAMDMDVKTGTDYVLSKHLATFNERIRLVKDSVIPSEYPPMSRQYVGMWRRWIKNLVVHDAREQWSHVLRATLLASLILGLPIEAWIAPRVLTAFSMFFFLIAVVKRYQYIGVGHKDGMPISRWLLLLVPYFTILDQVAVMMAIVDLVSPKRRYRW